MTKVVKKGHDDWADLKGKTLEFKFNFGWGDEGYVTVDRFSHTQPYHEDPRYPRYYVLDENGGGYSFWENEEVEVEILD